MLLSIAELLTRGRAPATPVHHGLNGTTDWQTFSARLSRLIGHLGRESAQRWLLACEEADEFTLWLLALLTTGKTVLIPPNFQPGTVRELSADIDAVAGNIAIDALPAYTGISASNLALACIELHTSGSAGLSKRVIKTVAQLEREIAVLEDLWGNTLGSAGIVATVPHHHIYGLLFRLLWPLAAGRPFDTVQCAHPDTLQQRIQTLGEVALVASPAQLVRLPQLVALEKIQPWPRLIFSSGGPLPLDAARALHAHGGVAPIEVYGSTETGGMAWRNQVATSWWSPFPGVRITTDADGASLRSPFLASDAPHRLDDGIELAEDNRFRLLGRIDRIVKVEEKRLSLPEMESRLQEHPWVAQAAAVILNGSRQSIGVALVLTPDGQATLASKGRPGMRAHLREHLAAHFDAVLLPRYWRYLDVLPYTTQGKLPVATLQALFAT